MTEQFQGMDTPEVSEKELLTERAKDLGIKNPHTMSVDTLKKKIKAKMEGAAETPTEAANQKMSQAQIRLKKAKEARKLVRVILRNLNPNKDHLTHDQIKVSNSVVGTIHRIVPTVTDERGTHVEQMLLDTMRDKEFIQKYKVKHAVTGEQVTKTRWAKEWVISELPPLTQEELDELKKEQQIRDNAELRV